MNKIKVLDCTLRDGGYCNQWNFGYDNITKIVRELDNSSIDIIECGFITNRVDYKKDVTKYTSLNQLTGVIPESNNLFVVMMNYGEYDIENLPDCDFSPIDGIRLAFHKKDRMKALELCQKIKDKGYRVFIQPMVSLSYKDEEFLEMIRIVNEIQPYAFYIVDSFGMMKNKDLIRLFYLVENNLDSDIWIGFHSHNNMQLAFSNAQTLSEINTSRNLIIDSSIFGMGRGAGNLNTEIFIQYLNENTGAYYKLKSILVLIDDIISDFYQKNSWGYSLPNYLSASYNAHPNYAGFLDDKKTLTIEAMSEIFEMMDDEKKIEFDKEYIEELYIRFMNTGKVMNIHREELINKIRNKKILLIAPGKSSISESDKIKKFIGEDSVTISVNSEFSISETDFIFLSNLRRFRELDNSKKQKCIVTSNIPADSVYYQVNYSELTNNVESVEDNAGLMCIKLLINLGVKEVYLAGFDGYSHDNSENYAEVKMVQFMKNALLDSMNQGMNEVLKKYSQQINIKFLTGPKYINI